ncbi:Gfo/Idh/MocA family oxidoreductase [Planctomycetales bacterium ZRK34]|nr:Gfo/Idh/MocA family oxidoreductase [Planctomycetales bacterium ZRK34]
MKTVRYGFIGCGAVGQRRHLRESTLNRKIEIAAVCDINKSRARRVGRQFAAPVYFDYRDMLRDAALDAVVVGTPNALHADMTVDACKAGCHVLCEKPMTITTRDARRMIKAAAQAKRFLMIGHNQRFMPPHVKAKRMIEAGDIGRVLSFVSVFKHGGPEQWSADGMDSWFFKKAEAGFGVLGDLAVHKVDLMRWLLDEEFTDVSARVATLDKRRGRHLMRLEDTALLTLRTASRIIGSIDTSWTNYGLEENHTTIYGDRGVLRIGIDPDYPLIHETRDGKRRRLRVGPMSTNKKQHRSGVIDAFTDCILQNRQPPIPAADAQHGLAVILTAIRAAKQGKTLKVR